MSSVSRRLVHAYIDYRIPPDGFENTLTRVLRRSRHPLYRWHMRTMNKLRHAHMAVHRCVTTPLLVIWTMTLGRWIYVKRCPNGPVEFSTLRFIQSKSSIPVPRPLLCFRYRGMYLVLMSRVPGVELEDAWPSLSADEKHRIITQLSIYIQQYRSIPPLPTQCISSVLGGPLTHPRVMFHGEIGPFRSEAHFNLQLRQTDKYTPPWVIETHRKRHRLVFTHGDLAPRNILVQDGVITALLDWGSAGWYPEHMEYCFTKNWGARECWIDWVVNLMEPYPEEAKADREVLQRIWSPDGVVDDPDGIDSQRTVE